MHVDGGGATPATQCTLPSGTAANPESGQAASQPPMPPKRQPRSQLRVVLSRSGRGGMHLSRPHTVLVPKPHPNAPSPPPSQLQTLPGLLDPLAPTGQLSAVAARGLVRAVADAGAPPPVGFVDGLPVYEETRGPPPHALRQRLLPRGLAHAEAASRRWHETIVNPSRSRPSSAASCGTWGLALRMQDCGLTY